MTSCVARVAALRRARRAAGACVRCGGDSCGAFECDGCHRRAVAWRRARYTRILGYPPQVYYCSGCGEAGHNVRTCVAPAGGYWSAEAVDL